MLSKQCPKCGKTEEQAKFIGAFCRDCFAIYHKTYSVAEVEVDRCMKCNSIREGRDWNPDAKGVVKKLVEKAVKTSYPAKVAVAVNHDPKGFLATASISLDVEGNSIEAVEKIRVLVNKTQCIDCSRKQGGYHEAIIQIRGNSTDRITQKIIEEIEKTSFITSVTEQKHGIDMQVGSKKAALQAVTSTGKAFTTTNKLVGAKDGKRLLKMTILLRV